MDNSLNHSSYIENLDVVLSGTAEDLDFYDRVMDYVENQMSQEERHAFELEMLEEPALRELVRECQSVVMPYETPEGQALWEAMGKRTESRVRELLDQEELKHLGSLFPSRVESASEVPQVTLWLRIASAAILKPPVSIAGEARESATTKEPDSVALLLPQLESLGYEPNLVRTLTNEPGSRCRVTYSLRRKEGAAPSAVFVLQLSDGRIFGPETAEFGEISFTLPRSAAELLGDEAIGLVGG